MQNAKELSLTSCLLSDRLDNAIAIKCAQKLAEQIYEFPGETLAGKVDDYCTMIPGRYLEASNGISRRLGFLSHYLQERGFNGVIGVYQDLAGEDYLDWEPLVNEEKV